jgi:hypothetical protein
VISSIYHAPQLVSPRQGRTKWAPGSHSKRGAGRSGGFTVRVFVIPTAPTSAWKPADHGYIPASNRQDAIRQAKLYRTFDVAVQQVSDGRSGGRWYVRFL